MSESNTGFSFGVPPEDDDIVDVDAVEVSGEPISRSEAKSLGFVQFDASREGKISSGVFRLDQLPADISDELSKKLETAWRHLKLNEIDDALTLAQEVVWEYPSLVAAKVIIARCFINRKEYPKALNILQAIGDSDVTAETHYYIALCQSRNGKIKEALDALKQAKALPADPVTRKRITDLSLQLQGEHVVCPVCGKKALYDSMVDAGEQTICAACAKNLPEESEDDPDDDGETEDEHTGKRRKRLRPPLTRADILMRVVFVIFLAVLLALGVWVMSFVSPEHYATIRALLPESWTFLPSAGSVSSISEIEAQAAQQQMMRQPTLSFDSPPLVRAVAGVRIKHRVFIQGMEKRDGQFTATIQPPPASDYQFDGDAGEFTWTPAAEDAGKAFTITFGATFNNVRAREQVNTVTVGAGPRFRNIHSLDNPPPGHVVHLMSVDLTDDDAQELLAVHGLYWEGQIDVVAESRDSFFQPLSHTALPGRPAGAGVIMAESETWLAVADYWNSRLRHYALRGGNLSEMAVDIDLPGSPLLAGFDKDSSTSAVVCRQKDRLSLLCYRQQDQLRTEMLGQWPLPDDIVWRALLILPGTEETGQEPQPVLIGGDPAGGILLADARGGKLTPQDIGVPGVIINAVAGPDGRVHCLMEENGRLSLVAFFPSPDGLPLDVVVTDAGAAPALGGMAVIGFYRENGGRDVVVFSSGRIGVAFARADGGYSDVAWWDLPAPFHPFGPVVAASATEHYPARLFYVDNQGDIWQVSMDEAEGEE